MCHMDPSPSALVRWKSDLADTEAAREEDQKVLLSLHSSCDKKASAWEARVKTRAEELLAIDETVKVLDSDDARNSLRKALPETSFLQVDSEDRKARALQGLLRQAPGSGADLLLLALKGQKIGFDKVVQMIDSMKNEKKKKEYCKQQFTGSDDKKRGLLLQVSNKETKMESAKDVLKVMESQGREMGLQHLPDAQELNEGLQRLDKDVADATEQRKKEHQEFLEMEKTSGEAAQLLQVAKKRLKQFYAKPPSLVEVSELVSVPGQAPEHQEYIQQKVNPILENLVTQLLLERPEQLAPFMIKWLSQNSKTPAAAALTEGVNVLSELKVEMDKLQEEVKDLEKQALDGISSRGRGTPQDSFLFAALDGHELKVLIDAMQEKIECTAGDAFGELALLYNCPRAASVEAGERSVLWMLDRESFNNIAGRLRQKLTPDLAMRSRMREEGTAVVSKVYVPGTPAKEVLRLAHGDYFGELALLNNDLRAATVTASSTLRRTAPDAPRDYEEAPETFDDYHKADEAAGVFVLLDALIRDIEHQMSQAETEEQEDQKGYEKIMQDRSKKRESDSQSVAKKTARKADVSSDLQVLKEGKANVKKESRHSRLRPESSP
eukprot:g3316.t1